MPRPLPRLRPRPVRSPPVFCVGRIIDGCRVAAQSNYASFDLDDELGGGVTVGAAAPAAPAGGNYAAFDLDDEFAEVAAPSPRGTAWTLRA